MEHGEAALVFKGLDKNQVTLQRAMMTSPATSMIVPLCVTTYTRGRTGKCHLPRSRIVQHRRIVTVT